ncbi:MAG: hypothetical protein ACLFVU_14105 [Phycisphaerae bacterium]
MDVGLALAFSGIAYLVWVLVAGAARSMVQSLINWSDLWQKDVPSSTKVIRVVFVDAGVALDIAGLLWLMLSMFLVVRSSRQRMSISWAWVSAVLQTAVAALGGIWVAWGVHVPYREKIASTFVPDPTPWQHVQGFSLGVSLAVALLLWVTFLVWLLVDRARLNRRGPTLTDGLRTNIYK